MVLGVRLMPRFATFTRRVALGLVPAALVAVSAAGTAGAVGTAALVSPAPGAILTTPPSAVTVRLDAAPAPGARLEVLNEGRGDLGNGPPQISGDTLRVAIPNLVPGIYTVSWSSGGSSGSSAFTVWNGGPLPPTLLRAAYGGSVPGQVPAPVGLCLLAAILAGLIGVGALAFPLADAATALGRGSRAGGPRGRSSAGILRAAGLTMAAACAAGAVLHTAAILGVTVRSLSADPLTRLVLLRGIGLDGLVGAGFGLIALLLAGLPRVSAVTLGLALVPALLMVPALQGGGGFTFAAALTAVVGLGLYAGAWPHALRFRGWASPLPRLAGLVVALATGIPLLLHWHPVAGATGIAAACAAVGAVLLGRPNAARRLTVGAQVVGLAAAVTLAPALAAASTRAGVHVLPRPPHWGYDASGQGGGVRLAISPLQVGVNVVQVTDPAARGTTLPVTLTNTEVPGLTRPLTLPRIAAGVYALATDALSLPGLWQADAAGATFRLTLGGPAPVAQGCSGPFTGFAAAVSDLGGPIRALATDPGDGTMALAATPTGVYATSDGGRTWVPAGDPGLVDALAIGLYGEWFAATGNGVQVSQDGGAHWSPAAGPGGATSALAVLLYPSGAPTWALSAGKTYGGVTTQTFTTTWATHWKPEGPAPAGVLALLALPAPVSWQPATLLAAGSDGLATSPDGGAHWTAVAGVPGPFQALAASARAFWAAGRGGVATATQPAGPWQTVPLAVFGPVTSIATAGPGGGDVFAAVAGAGLLLSTDAGRRFTGAGCAGGTVSAMAGTFVRTAPSNPPAGAPLVYVGDVGGRVAALWQAGTGAP